MSEPRDTFFANHQGTRVSPPGRPYGNPNNWPVAVQVDNPDHLCKLLDAIHDNALVAWDRDVRLRDGNIIIATSDRSGPESGVGGHDILGYAYVDSVTIWQLWRVASDPLGLQWIAYGPMSPVTEPDPVTTTEHPTTAKPPRKRRNRKRKAKR